MVAIPSTTFIYLGRTSDLHTHKWKAIIKLSVRNGNGSSIQGFTGGPERAINEVPTNTADESPWVGPFVMQTKDRIPWGRVIRETCLCFQQAHGTTE
jgi:hypothetical protein